MFSNHCNGIELTEKTVKDSIRLVYLKVDELPKPAIFKNTNVLQFNLNTLKSTNSQTHLCIYGTTGPISYRLNFLSFLHILFTCYPRHMVGRYVNVMVIFNRDRKKGQRSCILVIYKSGRIKQKLDENNHMQGSFFLTCLNISVVIHFKTIIFHTV